ncbi:unnamed protein product [Caenorhabditis angaria]|uniref:Uncharacterized protein n=1 Tax=Caenorhabditis angaria TaxID=860376 RepID=A0A9P1IP67_9PELO|nr:unnamed protein product [Caenorhabditis angaria]
MVAITYNISIFPDFEPIEHFDPTVDCRDPSSCEHVAWLFVSIDIFQFNYLAPLFATIFDFLVQVINVGILLKRKYLKNGPFFKILLIMSTSVILRCLHNVVNYSCAAIFSVGSSTYKTSLRNAVYSDFFFSFFLVTLIFLMSLNRCLCFVSKDWNDLIFEEYHYLIPVFLSFSISLIATIISIQSSKIKRVFQDSTGFIDYSENLDGYNTMIVRMFYIFPIGSSICYIVLFRFMRRKSRMALTSKNAGQKIFTQLLVTVIFYGLMCIFYEAVVSLDDFLDINQISKLISLLNIINNLPEIALPFMLLISRLDLCKKSTKVQAISSTTASNIVR